ncbi:MAG: PAS domain-containing protein [Bacteroidia bacterium]
MDVLKLDFQQAKVRHLLFKNNLRSIINGIEVDEKTILSAYDCELGKWIYDHSLKKYGHIPEMHDLEKVHTAIHKSAREIITLFKNGNVEDAREGLSNIEQIADQLITLLNIIEVKLKESTYASEEMKEDKLLNVNYKEMVELYSVITSLEIKIKQQSEEINASRKKTEFGLLNSFAQAPIAICVLRGNEFNVELANDLYLQLVDKKSDFIGKPLFESLPELEGQGIREMLEGVLTNGIAFNGKDINVILNRNGHSEQTFFNFTYQPLKEEEGVTKGVMVVCNEVTSEVLAKKKIEENERLLQVAVDSAKLGTFEFDVKTKALKMSKRYLALFGFDSTDNPTHEEILKRIHPDDLKARDAAMKISAQTGVLDYYARIILINGDIRYLSMKAQVFYDASNLPDMIVGTVMDITESKEDQEKIIKANRTLSIALKAGHLGTFQLEIESGQSNLNDTGKENYDFPLDSDVTHDMIMNRIHSEDKSYVQDALNTAIKSKKNYNVEYRIIINNGTVRWISSSGQYVYNENDKAIRLVGINANITDRKLNEEKLSISIGRFQLLADSMPQFIWTGDASGNLDYFNQSVYDFSGLSTKEIAANGWLQIVHPDDREANTTAWINSIAKGTDFIFQHRFKKFNGEYRWQLSRAVPQKNKKGEIVMWVGTSTDIHDQKEFEQQLEKRIDERTMELKIANIDLKNMNEELSAFAYVSSHDLQEPLRKIQTFISRIKESDDPTISESSKNYINKIEDSSARMKNLINDLLTYSRTGATENFFEPTDLSKIFIELNKDFSEALEDTNGIIELGDMPIINAIPFQIRQLFFNLISNAIKFAQPDVSLIIKIDCKLINGDILDHPSAHNGNRYHELSVSDNGIGFNNRFGNKVFEVFQKLHNKDIYEGTGIGLSICKKIALNHGGFITVDSQENVGTTFKIYIPFSLSE